MAAQTKQFKMQMLTTALPAHIEATHRMFAKCYASALHVDQKIREEGAARMCHIVGRRAGELFRSVANYVIYHKDVSRERTVCNDVDFRTLTDELDYLRPWAKQVNVWAIQVHQSGIEKDEEEDFLRHYWQSFHFDEWLILTLCCVRDGSLQWRNAPFSSEYQGEEYMPSLSYFYRYIDKSILRGKHPDKTQIVAYAVFYLLFSRNKSRLIEKEEDIRKHLLTALELYEKDEGEKGIYPSHENK